MLDSTLTAPQAWRRDTIDAAEHWYERLPDRLLDALDGPLRAAPDPLTAVRLTPALRDLARHCLRRISDTLERGRGFVVIETPQRDYDDRQRTLLYWLVGQGLGGPMVQNVQGTLLYDVKDTGQDVRYGARFSVTNAESSFHTDGSFFDETLDYVGLLCLKPARSGGISQVANGLSAHEELRSRHPQALAVLGRPFHIDRRGGMRPGETPTAQFPVVSGSGTDLTYRYLRYWIEAGHDKVGQPLSPAQVTALDTLDGVLNDPALRVDFVLRPGDMLFFNNRFLLHNRTAFEDFDEPERRRHLVRLWLARQG